MNSLDRNNPIIIGMNISPKFKTSNFLKRDWKHIKKMKELHMGHAMVVVDYDEKNEEFTLMNSYGNDWSDDGFIKIDFADYSDLVKYGVIISLGRQDCD